MSEEQDIDTFHQFIQGAGAFKIENDGGMRQEIGGRLACLRTCLVATSTDSPYMLFMIQLLKLQKLQIDYIDCDRKKLKNRL